MANIYVRLYLLGSYAAKCKHQSEEGRVGAMPDTSSNAEKDMGTIGLPPLMMIACGKAVSIHQLAKDITMDELSILVQDDKS